MAVQRNDRLEKALSGIATDNRFTTWLWLYLKTYHPQPNPGDLDSYELKNRLAEIITNNQQLKQEIEIQRDLHLIPEENLRWIKNNKRQRHWINKKITEISNTTYTFESARLTDRDIAIAIIDILRIDPASKVFTINDLSAKWDMQNADEAIFSWFSESDEEEKLNLAWEMACKNSSLITGPREPFKDTADIIIFFDSPIYNSATKKLFIETTKKRWSQNKYRAKMTGKKQYNFVLSDKANNALKKLAEKYDLPRARILEILLQMEDQKGIYIPEKIKTLIDF